MNLFVLHIDVNSAFLSWTADDRLKNGEAVDIRNIASVIGGDEAKRCGIVLAKSIPAKKYNILTGESLFSARRKCPCLEIFSPNYRLYKKYSASLVNILYEYSPNVQQFSIDECFIDLYANTRDEIIKIANIIKDRIDKELGFSVNIGVSHNKLLAKMASDFHKPNKVHSLFENEIRDKMWHLPIGDLYMVGRSTEKKLRNIGITNIGQLANTDLYILKSIFKSFGIILFNYANGIEASPVCNIEKIKGIGNSTTLIANSCDIKFLNTILLTLCESVSTRLRSNKSLCTIICVEIKDCDFLRTSSQKKFQIPTDVTMDIYEISKPILNSLVNGKSIRQLGVRLSGLVDEFNQISFFDNIKSKKIDITTDMLRKKYGFKSVVRLSNIKTDFLLEKLEEEHPKIKNLL